MAVAKATLVMTCGLMVLLGIVWLCVYVPIITRMQSHEWKETTGYVTEVMKVPVDMSKQGRGFLVFGSLYYFPNEIPQNPWENTTDSVAYQIHIDKATQGEADLFNRNATVDLWFSLTDPGTVDFYLPNNGLEEARTFTTLGVIFILVGLLALGLMKLITISRRKKGGYGQMESHSL